MTAGAKNVVVALARRLGISAAKAEGEGLKVMGIAEAAAWCDLIMFTMPDELQAETYKKYVHDNLREGAAIAFRPRPERALRPDRAESPASTSS